MSARQKMPAAYDLVFSVPTLDFAARVGRKAKYAVPLMDEMLVRTVHLAGKLTLGAVASLLRLTAVQLDAFLAPLLRGNLLTITDDGLIGLGPRGEAAMAHATGEPPKLTRIEEATESFRLDLADCKFCVVPQDRRTYFGTIELDPGAVRSRGDVRDIAHEALLQDHAGHMAYLEEHGYRRSEAKEIEYVIDIDEGRGGKIEINVRVHLDETGHAMLDFCDFRTEEQRQLRRTIVERIKASCREIREVCTPESRALFSQIVSSAREIATNDSSAPREYWGEDSISCVGRIESRDGPSAVKLIDRFVPRLTLLKGDQARRADWIVVLASASRAFATGRDYCELLRSIVKLAKARVRQIKVLLLSPSSANLTEQNAIVKFADAHATIEGADHQLAGIDGIFVPSEFAYVALADDAPSGGAITTQSSVMTVESDRVRDVSCKIFSAAIFNILRQPHGIEASDWTTLLTELRTRSRSAETRILRLKPKAK